MTSLTLTGKTTLDDLADLITRIQGAHRIDHDSAEYFGVINTTVTKSSREGLLVKFRCWGRSRPVDVALRFPLGTTFRWVDNGYIQALSPTAPKAESYHVGGILINGHTILAVIEPSAPCYGLLVLTEYCDAYHVGRITAGPIEGPDLLGGFGAAFPYNPGDGMGKAQALLDATRELHARRNPVD